MPGGICFEMLLAGMRLWVIFTFFSELAKICKNLEHYFKNASFRTAKTFNISI